jgi:hypothetical protein
MTNVKKHKMVGWYGPRQLASTGYQVFISTIFGKHGDKRILHAIGDDGSLRKRCFYEINDPGDQEFWFDYVSDVGDGFDSTYTVAYHLTRPELKLTTKDDQAPEHITNTGSLLIFGGDEVYPTASRSAYEERLVDPYNLALPKRTPAQRQKDGAKALPAVFAVPGNHDWYDSLVVFMSLFCRGKKFCGWQTYQNRSYFAIKLPRGWWLVGTDMQLASSLDDGQMDYFEAVVKRHVKEGERIVLCNAEPHWITRAMYPDNPDYNNRNMGYFEGRILDKKVAVHVAGDRHYYRRHEETYLNGVTIPPSNPSKIQRIVAGGGGAFLHPTHGEKVDEVGIRHKFKLRKSFPDETTARWLGLSNLKFPVLNPLFGLVTGFLYLVTAQAFTVDLSVFGISRIGDSIAAVALNAFTEPLASLWTFLIIAGFIFFTDTHKSWFRWVAGPIHALLHLTGVFLLGWAAAYCFRDLHPAVSTGLSAVLVFAGGYVYGSVLMGIYLLLSLNFFGVHQNEAFSSLKIADYKNFLRFKIERNGDLTIFPIGIEKVSKNWRDGDWQKGEPKKVPAESSDKTTPFLIEEPITFVKPLNRDEEGTPGKPPKALLTEEMLITTREVSI